MKITLLSTFERLGGASIAASRLQEGLRLAGHDSWMLVKSKTGASPYVRQLDLSNRKIQRREQAFRLIEQYLYDSNRTELSNTRFSLPYPGYDLSRAGLIRSAEVVNLHWVALFQSVESVAALLVAGRPVVWTLHDQHPFTGGCHYTAGCAGYRQDCLDCPQLRYHFTQLPAKILEAKKRAWQQNLTIVTPSRWLAGCARHSSLFGKFRVEVIPNSIDHEIYRPVEKIPAKTKLGLNPDCLHLLFNSYTGQEKRKGFLHLRAALQYCLRQERFRALADRGGVAILVLGPVETGSEGARIDFRPLGMVEGDGELASIYAAADLVVLPSEEENLPNVMLESMACGTPVVSFAAGGMPDVIEDGKNGLLAPVLNADRLGEAILRLVFEPDLRAGMGLRARQTMVADYKLADQSRRYLELFKELTAARRPVLDPVPAAAAGPEPGMTAGREELVLPGPSSCRQTSIRALLRLYPLIRLGRLAIRLLRGRPLLRLVRGAPAGGAGKSRTG